jgi:hypothetical protein
MNTPSQDAMESYKSETREVVNRFLRHKLDFPDCIATLDAALAALIPKLNPEELPALRDVVLANNEIVMREMERREGKRKSTAVNRPSQTSTEGEQ